MEDIFWKTILIIILGFSTGITIGSAIAAFLTLIKLVPRVVHIGNTHAYIRLYEYGIILGVTIISLLYFLNFRLGISKYFSIPIGLIMGIFYGFFASALAEVLNVIPVFVKKVKAKDQLNYIIGALIVGKTFGSLYYWLIFLK